MEYLLDEWVIREICLMAWVLGGTLIEIYKLKSKPKPKPKPKPKLKLKLKWKLKLNIHFISKF